MKQSSKKMLTLSYIVLCLGGVLAALGTLGVNYYGQKAKTENTTDKTVTVDKPVNSPVTGHIENQTNNYYQNAPDTTHPKQKSNLNKKTPAKEPEKGTTININSYNQSGGITANEVHINTHERKLTDDLKKVFIQNIDGSFEKNNVTKSCLITIAVPMGDGESVRFATSIREYLIGVGYNVWPNNNTYGGNVGMGNSDIRFYFNDTKKEKPRLDITLNYAK